MRRATTLAVGGLAGALLAGGGITLTGVTDLARSPTEASPPEAEQAAARATDTVTRRTLQRESDFTGSLGYGVPFGLPGQATGTVTWAPERGTVLRPGELLYRADERPTYWIRGDVPMYRELAWGTKGPDVEQLQHYLREAGYLSERARLTGAFGRATARAVRNWQKDRGLERTGVLDAAQLLVLPYDALRVAAVPRVGDPAVGGVLEVTEPEVVVTVGVRARDRAVFEGEPAVVVETVNAERHPATVESVSARPAPEDGGSPGFEVRLRVTGAEDLEPDEVAVEVTTTLAEDVLTVPVQALVALAGGGYAVEVPLADGSTEYRPVEIGEFAEGEVEVSGEFAEGDEVVMPG